MELVDIITHSVNYSEKFFMLLKTIFSPNKFLLYDVNKNGLLERSWYRSFSILVIYTPDINVYEKKLMKIVKESICDGKKIILICENFEFGIFKEAKYGSYYILENNVYEIQKDNKTLLLLFENLDAFYKNHELVSKIWDLTKYSINQIQCHHGDLYVFSENHESISSYLESFKLSDPLLNKFQYNSLEFNVNLSDNQIFDSNKPFKLLTNINDKNPDFQEIVSFKSNDYFSSLYTKYLGKIVLFSEVLSSSFDLMERIVQLGNFQPIVIISYVQTAGKGRGSNKWISPLGCAMYTCLIPIQIRSRLGNSMSLIQHIMAVSIVEAINFLCWIDKDSLKIKWPNDVYWNQHGKIAGIILKAIMQNDYFYCFLGIGINVYNSEPTVCIYDIIRSFSNDELSNINYPSMEKVIAHVLTRFERNIYLIQSSENGIENFKSKYYQYWMHKDQVVTVRNGENSVVGTIVGIDDFGFLQMMPQDNSEKIVTLHPDGNTFDMMNNLIIPK